MDPYAYTSGRWLRNHAAETAARQLRFDFDGLCRRAVACRPGASKVVRWEKYEGSYNRAFVLHLDDGSTLVARVPFSAAGPPRLVTNSEVATMAYLRKMTSIPIPEVLDWSDDPLNPLKTEYIIMQHVEGVQLRDRWDAMSPQEHLLCVKSLALLVKEMHLLQFPAYGSIYFDSASVDARHRIPLLDGFFIGPSLAHRYWAECAPGEGRWYKRRQPNRGPWTTFEAFTQSLLDTGVSHFPPETVPGTLEYYGTVEENLELLATLGKVTAKLSKDPRIQMVSGPKLFHNDLHMRNIFVSHYDATKITGVIDWQSTTLDPVLLYAHMTPDLCTSPRFTEDLLEEGGEEERNGDDVYETAATAAEREKIQSDVDRCRKTWELSLYVHAQKLHDARALDEALLRPYRQCFSTWQYGATATRDVLKELSARWSELALPGQPPYQPTDEELVHDAKRSEDFQAVLMLEKWHQHALDLGSDGWVPTERWDDVLELHEEFYNNWMDAARTASDEGMSEEKAAKMWPFDPPVSLRQIGRAG
ncbi:kinase-like domain-containing protein [Lasiosphaeria hispida]|uniref:Altered inheritance of mitochondria protein 9, mitochondrial n=1 Tax=Lasiosphaeria hispida TaxID=260671 RepID=A0AAJ0MCE9_9PEZI|nr:kinase-like domain-containing protein [Lasiosphaeria hispida]